MLDGTIEGIVLKDRESPYRDVVTRRLVEAQGPQSVRARGVEVRPSMTEDMDRQRLVDALDQAIASRVCDDMDVAASPLGETQTPADRAAVDGLLAEAVRKQEV
jgi:hypothetical protein